MTELYVTRIGYALRGASDEDTEAIHELPMGETYKCKITRPRNPKFHNKAMALLRFGYEHYTPAEDPEWEAKWGMTPAKNFDRYRKEVTMLAGYTEAYYSMGRDKIIVEPRSISFAKMDETTFSEYYNNIKTVIWNYQFSKMGTYTKDEWETVVMQLERFD